MPNNLNHSFKHYLDQKMNRNTVPGLSKAKDRVLGCTVMDKVCRGSGPVGANDNEFGRSVRVLPQTLDERRSVFGARFSSGY